MPLNTHTHKHTRFIWWGTTVVVAACSDEDVRPIQLCIWCFSVWNNARTAAMTIALGRVLVSRVCPWLDHSLSFWSSRFRSSRTVFTLCIPSSFNCWTDPCVSLPQFWGVRERVTQSQRLRSWLSESKTSDCARHVVAEGQTSRRIQKLVAAHTNRCTHGHSFEMVTYKTMRHCFHSA